MIQPKILLTRIDDRFIYGQDVELWNEAVGSNLVLIVNDEIAADSRKWAPMRVAAPEGVWTRFFSVQRTIDIIHTATPRQWILIMVASPADALALVKGGVTVLECYGGRVSVMRGITTRTKTGQTQDATFRELGTILIVDDVVPAIRRSLRAKFTRAKNNALTRNAIRSQVIVELEDRIEREIIEGYDNLTVTALESDPTTCLVEFEFTVVHGLNRIFLTAHISV